MERDRKPHPEPVGPRDDEDLDLQETLPVFAPQARPRKLQGKRWQEFYIPIHGLVRLTDREVQVVNHPALQRLGDVYQLGQTHLVYRGATHHRLEHSLGTLHLTQQFIDAIERNRELGEGGEQDTGAKWRLDAKLTNDEIALTRLAALMHDVGHVPAGHTLEDELGFLPRHDGVHRLELVLKRSNWRGHATVPTLEALINDLYGPDAHRSGLSGAEGRALTASAIVLLLVSSDSSRSAPAAPHQFRLRVCRDIVSNTISADLLDYLHRDWWHLGKPRAFDSRLLDYMELRAVTASVTPESRFVINLRGGSSVRTDAVTAILDLLESRYQLGEIALYHRTKLCAAAMLERSVAEIADAHGDARENYVLSLEERLLDVSDPELLGLLDSDVIEALSSATESVAERLRGVEKLLGALRLRQLHKAVVTKFEYQLSDASVSVQDLYAGPSTERDRFKRARVGAANRLAALRLLERDFGLAPGTVVMYCPPREMNTKIAEVQVLIHGDVYTLDRFESDHGDRGITGGHLAAQKQRFRRLWRVLFALETDAWDRLDQAGLLQPFGRAIELCILRIEPAAGTIDSAIRSLAKELTGVPGSPLHKGQVINGDIAARVARGSRKRPGASAGPLYYPGNAPSLLACIGR
jgi:HD superfamily phosphohydrolase